MWMQNPIISHKGIGSNKFVTSNFYSKGNTFFSGFELIDSTPGSEETVEVKFRRVENNENATIQFQIKTIKNGRSYHTSFSIPARMADEFVKQLL